jgi:hypothetical protein
MRVLIAAALLILASSALAERPVYKNLGPDGKVTYSDRRWESRDAAVRNWQPAHVERHAYESAVMRAEYDRAYYARLQAERRQPVPTVVYDPRGRSVQPGYDAGERYVDYRGYGSPRHGGWDPNLPRSPAPSLERNYYYDGR